jgi:hypothetical protein
MRPPTSESSNQTLPDGWKAGVGGACLVLLESLTMKTHAGLDHSKSGYAHLRAWEGEARLDGFSRGAVPLSVILFMLFLGLDIAVGAIWGRQAFGAVCAVTTILMVLVLNRWGKASS